MLWSFGPVVLWPSSPVAPSSVGRIPGEGVRKKNRDKKPLEGMKTETRKKNGTINKYKFQISNYFQKHKGRFFPNKMMKKTGKSENTIVNQIQTQTQNKSKYGTISVTVS